jgi:hypothetical protein
MNMPARKLGLPPVFGHKANQGALCAGPTLALLLVKIDAGRGILEYEIGTPGKPWPPPVPTLFQESQFRCQNLEQLLTVMHP